MDIRSDRRGIEDLSRGRVRRALRFVREKGVIEVLRLLRRHGLRAGLDFAGRNIRHMIADRIARRWDREHNVDTAGSIQLEFLSVAGANRRAGTECVCTSPKSFGWMMRFLPRDLGRHTFVDIGAGKSRTLLLASEHSFARVTGVEFARELVAVSRRNLKNYRSATRKCRALDITEGDAATYGFPPGPLVVYFYNPFSEPLFRDVLANLKASLAQSPRECFVIYASSSNNTIDWARPAIASLGIFEEISSEPMPLFLDAVRTIRFAVYRTKAVGAMEWPAAA